MHAWSCSHNHHKFELDWGRSIESKDEICCSSTAETAGVRIGHWTDVFVCSNIDSSGGSRDVFSNDECICTLSHSNSCTNVSDSNTTNRCLQRE